MNWMQRAVARHHRGEEEGFTLIELLIVILILGILATIVVLGIGAFQNTGKSQACITTAHNVETAYAGYTAKNGTPPPGPTDAAKIGVLVTDKYLKSTPTWAFTLDADGNVTNTATVCA
jgi:general secretion pathway protein G